MFSEDPETLRYDVELIVQGSFGDNYLDFDNDMADDLGADSSCNGREDMEQVETDSNGENDSEEETDQVELDPSDDYDPKENMDNRSR